MSKIKLSLCVMTKNEEEYIEKCILSVKDIVDEIIILDSDSTDRTIAIASKYTDKIYSYKWQNDFSFARNELISYANGEWILMLDADEFVRPESLSKILHFIQSTTYDGCHFTVYNYIGKLSDNNYTIHKALRLFKNNKKYHYTGSIHEQLTSVDYSINIKEKLTSEDIIIDHYGYLDTTVKRQKKRERNLPILIKQLEVDQENPFTLFNIGNEYYALKDYDKAIEYYEQSSFKSIGNEAFVPQLFYRLITCYIEIKDFEKGLELAELSHSSFTQCTEYIFLKATIYNMQNRYTLAIKSYEQCIEMGASPTSLQILNDVHTFRSHIALATIYDILSDYDEAILHYKEAFKYNSDLSYLLVNIGKVLKKQKYDSNSIRQQLQELTSNNSTLIVLDALIELNSYEQAKILLDQNEEVDSIFNQYYTSVINIFLDKKTNYASSLLDLLLDQKVNNLDLNKRSKILQYIIASQLLHNESLDIIQESIINDNSIGPLINVINKIINKEVISEEEELTNEFLDFTLGILEVLLIHKELDLFEKYVEILNYINSERVLTRLGKLYYKHDLVRLSVDTFIRSMKYMNYIDKQSLLLIFKESYLF